MAMEARDLKKFCIALVVLLLSGLSFNRCSRETAVAIVVGQGAPALEQFAATELRSYLKSVYGIEASITHDRATGEGRPFPSRIPADESGNSRSYGKVRLGRNFPIKLF
jgi:hypothetical protein